MEKKVERKGTTLGEVNEWLKEHGPEDIRSAAMDFADDVGRLYGPDGSVVAPGLGLMVSGELGVRPARDEDNEDNEEETDDGQEIS